MHLYAIANDLHPAITIDMPSEHTPTANNNAMHPMTPMHGMYGRYPATRESSGTSWVPDSSPQEGFHIMRKDWMLMFNGYSYLVWDQQGGRQGGKKIFNENMFMFMAQKDFNASTLAFRTMFSLEALTIGNCGYPLILQTGETCNGITPLINKQHPHDLFMELALVYSYAFSPDTSAFLYAALPGEPALGPPVFMMRFSSEYNPNAPLGHHWMDSTHITFGVLTGGLIHKGLKLELSGFKGREPDEHRFNIEKPTINSYSIRLSCNPTSNIALQASYAFLKSPEQLHPDINTQKYILSAIYNKPFGRNNLQASAIIGINRDRPVNPLLDGPGDTLPAFLLEATMEIHKKNMIFSRLEVIQKDDLITPPNNLVNNIFTVEKFTLGYIHEWVTNYHIKWGIGGLVDFPLVPRTIKPYYDNTPCYMIFLQARLI